MAFSQSLNPNVFEKHNRVLFLPSSWKRLMSLIKYQVPNGGFAVMEGEFGAGKSAFGQIFEKKLVLDENIDCQMVQVHPLSTIQQIQAQLPKNPEKPMVVIIDDAHEASTLLLQKLTVSVDNIYWLLLAEPGISERVESFKERRVELPLFNKDDCFEFLQKQLHDQPKYAQVSQMQSDTIWYSSEGLPKEIIHHAKNNLGKLFTGQESSENFEKSNKSWFMTAALALAGLILIVFLIINISDEDVEDLPEKAKPKELVIHDVDTDLAQDNKKPEDKVARSNQNELNNSNSKTNPIPIENPEITNIMPEAPAIEASKETEEKSSETIAKQPVVKKADEQDQLSAEDVEQAANTADPIESIALKVAKKETAKIVENTTDLTSTDDFNEWLNSQSQDAYSLQLFSHSKQEAAQTFQRSLDLADSYVYSADLDNGVRYRVLWGAFDTRAEAKQAIKSLPSEILAQKPWIRQFSAISNELSKSTTKN